MDEGNFESIEFIEGESADNINPSTPEITAYSSGEGNNIDISWNYTEDIDFAYHQTTALDNISYTTVENNITVPLEDESYDEYYTNSVDIHDNLSDKSDYIGAHDLHEGASLVGICVIPEDNLIGNVITGEHISGVIGSGVAANQITPGSWVGSLIEIDCGLGYWINTNEAFIHLTAGHKCETEEYVLDDALELISYCCPLEKPVSEIGNGDIIQIIGEGQATQQLANGTWVGSLTELSPGSGYWVKSNGNTTLNFDCEE